MASNGLFNLTEEHEMIRQAARDFAQNEIAPIAAEFDESGEFPRETIKKMGEMGFMGIEVPEEYGGAGIHPTPCRSDYFGKVLVLRIPAELSSDSCRASHKHCGISRPPRAHLHRDFTPCNFMSHFNHLANRVPLSAAAEIEDSAGGIRRVQRFQR